VSIFRKMHWWSFWIGMTIGELWAMFAWPYIRPLLLAAIAQQFPNAGNPT
jgi:hypothetical protein